MPSLSIHLTDLCNSRCNFCVVGSPHYVADTIDYQRLTSFLQENAGRGYTSVNIHGGEATIHPKFTEVLGIVSDLGYPEVHLQTNGIRLADKAFAQKLCQLGVTLFIVSLHGSNAAVHDAQTKSKGGLVRTVDGIRHVKEFGAAVRTNTVVTQQNTADLPSIALTACELGVDHLNFSNLHPVGSATFSFDRIVPKFSDVREHLYPAIEVGLSRNKTVTLEGFPYCTVEKFSHLHIHESRRDIKMLMRGMVVDDYDAFMNQTCRVFGGPCEACSISTKCGGVYPEYVDRLGWSEFRPALARA